MINAEWEQLMEDAETLERAVDILRREATKKPGFMFDVLLQILIRAAASLRSQARKLDETKP